VTLTVCGHFAPQAEEKKAEQDLDESIDYLSALKRIILDEVDTDGTYGLVNDELVPLPFDTPKVSAAKV
jgi:hypothetical protein